MILHENAQNNSQHLEYASAILKIHQGVYTTFTHTKLITMGDEQGDMKLGRLKVNKDRVCFKLNFHRSFRVQTKRNKKKEESTLD